MVARAVLAVVLCSGFALADVTVDTIVDADVDDASCSLREAIVAAATDASYHGCIRSGLPGPDTIAFDIGTGTPTIVVTASDLPPLSGTTTLDGATGGATRVEIAGGGTRSTGIQFFGADASGSVVRHLVINGFTTRQLFLSNGSDVVIEGNLIGTDAAGAGVPAGTGAGIEVCTGFSCGTSNGHHIGGATPAQRNVIVAGSGAAILLNGSANCVLEGNFVNVDATGTMRLGNAFARGVEIGNANGTIIGGAAVGAGNLLNGFTGILIGGNPSLARSSGTVIQGNTIGTDLSGSVGLGDACSNSCAGIQLFHAFATQIGGLVPGAGNLISGRGNAIEGGSSGVSGTSVDDTTVQGNLIGTDASGTGPIGNTTRGISLGDSAVIEENVIAFSGDDGIEVNCGACIQRIAKNAIHSNGGLGIDLNGGVNGVDANDPGDPDGGPNGRQNYPALAAESFPGGTSVSGTLNSTSTTTFRVEIFANLVCDPSGNGEGQTYVGAADDVATDVNGDASFTVTLDQSVPAGMILTATAIAPDGSTSEFSPCTPSSPGSTTTTSTSTTTTTVASTTSTTTTTSTTSTSAPGSSTSTSIASTTTSTIIVGPSCELLTGKKLLLKSRTGRAKRGLVMLSTDPGITLGGGNGSADDPVRAGGSVRVVAQGGDRFDDEYQLAADRWHYRKGEGANKGYRLQPTSPFEAIDVRPGKRLRIVANGEGLGHTLSMDPTPVDVVVTLGDHCYCLRFGGEVRFKPDKKLLAKNADPPVGCVFATR